MLELDGSQYLICVNDPSLDIRGPMTIAAWVRALRVERSRLDAHSAEPRMIFGLAQDFEDLVRLGIEGAALDREVGAHGCEDEAELERVRSFFQGLSRDGGALMRRPAFEPQGEREVVDVGREVRVYFTPGALELLKELRVRGGRLGEAALGLQLLESTVGLAKLLRNGAWRMGENGSGRRERSSHERVRCRATRFPSPFAAGSQGGAGRRCTEHHGNAWGHSGQVNPSAVGSGPGAGNGFAGGAPPLKR